MTATRKAALACILGHALAIGLGVAIVLASVLVFGPADVAAPALAALGDPSGWVLAAPIALPALRDKRADLVTRSEAKRSELVDGLAAEAVTRIEADHQALLDQIAAVDTEIRAAEDAEPQTRDAPPPAPPPASPDAQAIAERAVAAERTRCTTIRDLATRAGHADMAERHIAAGTTVEAFRAALFDAMVERQSRAPIDPHVRIGQDETETRRDGMAAALAARMARAAGERDATIPENARRWGEMGVVEMAAECIGYRGHLRTPRQVVEVFERAAHTTSDFPAIFVDAMNRRLLARYQTAAPTYRRFCARYNVDDFRDLNVIRAGDFPALQPVAEDGEIKSGTFSESKEKHSVKAYGVILNISRHMIINDQLMAIDQVLASAGQRVSDFENALAFQVLLMNSAAGPVLLTDSKNVFHTGHGNLTSSGTAVGIASIGVGRAAMAKQKTLDGLPLNLQPAVILCGPDRIQDVEQILSPILAATAGNAVPEAIRRLVPVSDGSITDNSWYLFADPTVAPCFVYGYLNGFEGPRLTSEVQFSVQGVRTKLEHDFGVSAIDWRGGYRNAGAAPAG